MCCIHHMFEKVPLQLLWKGNYLFWRRWDFYRSCLSCRSRERLQRQHGCEYYAEHLVPLLCESALSKLNLYTLHPPASRLNQLTVPQASGSKHAWECHLVALRTKRLLRPHPNLCANKNAGAFAPASGLPQLKQSLRTSNARPDRHGAVQPRRWLGRRRKYRCRPIEPFRWSDPACPGC